jgi:hypothetical protein
LQLHKAFFSHALRQRGRIARTGRIVDIAFFEQAAGRFGGKPAIRRDRFLLQAARTQTPAEIVPQSCKAAMVDVGDDFNWGWTQVQLKRTLDALETALYHTLGKLPEPKSTHEFF